LKALQELLKQRVIPVAISNANQLINSRMDCMVVGMDCMVDSMDLGMVGSMDRMIGSMDRSLIAIRSYLVGRIYYTL
jgi:hypothetical protein